MDVKFAGKGFRRGFSLVELLAVVLILSILSAVAVPLYLSTRKVAAARACKANIAAMATAESSFALRYGKYTSLAGLLSAPEGLAYAPTCPLDNSAYAITTGGVGGTAVTTYVPATNSDGTTAAITIACPNADVHFAVQGAPSTVANWQVSMGGIVTDSLP